MAPSGPAKVVPSPGAINITQGDLIFECPLIGWKAEGPELTVNAEGETLKAATDAFAADVVIMTQACDLEYDKVENVVLCPHLSLTDYRSGWENAMRTQEPPQNPTPRAWSSHYKDIREGLVWNLTVLNSLEEGLVTTEHRIVDFHEVFTIPRPFLEAFLKNRNQQRLRLLPPYREHLSQAFARFFMRVGLPVPVARSKFLESPVI